MKLKEIHTDERRKISLIDGMFSDDKEFTIIELNKNKAAGGCLHEVDEFFCIISGIVLAKIGDEVKLLEAGESGCIKAGSPHIEWKGKGTDEVGIDKNTGKVVIRINPDYFRPTEVDLLLGDASKAKRELGWEAKTKFKDLVKIMVKSDYELVKSGGPILY